MAAEGIYRLETISRKTVQIMSLQPIDSKIGQKLGEFNNMPAIL